MNLAVRHLKAIGYRASGLISDQELVKAVRAETRAHHYDEVILATPGKAVAGWRAACTGIRFISCGSAGGNIWSSSRPARAPSRPSDSTSSSNAASNGANPPQCGHDAGQIAAEGQTESAVQTRLGLDLPALHDLCAGLLARVPRRKIRVPEGWG
jgi:hypothetical protein